MKLIPAAVQTPTLSICDRLWSERKLSTEFWYDAMMSGCVDEPGLLRALEQELPSMTSLHLERTCNLQCLHCIYQEEPSSQKASEAAQLISVACNIISQLPDEHAYPHFETPLMLHEGRILRPWHIQLLAQAKKIRPDLRLGLIDNGTYTRLIPMLHNASVRLSWIDISVDGTETAHNTQRNDSDSYRVAINGLERGREIADKVTSLMTVTTINHAVIRETADIVLSSGLADEFHITLMSPARAELAALEVSSGQMKTIFSQVASATAKYSKEKIFFRLYRRNDLLKLGEVLGFHKLLRALQLRAEVGVGEITFEIDGVMVSYFPTSLWPNETVLIDADASYRVAYSGRYTLKELTAGVSNDGEDISQYTVSKLNTESSLKDEYQKCVGQWWNAFGRKNLSQEMETFNQIKTTAQLRRKTNGRSKHGFSRRQAQA